MKISEEDAIVNFSKKNKQHIQTSQNKNPASNNKIDIQFTLGQDGGQDLMADIKLVVNTFMSTNIKQKQIQLLKEIQSNQEVKQDLLLVFKFKVQQGREKQGLEFFEKGLDQHEDDKNISAMQSLFHRPKSAGRIQLKQGKGQILVIYRLYDEYLNALTQFYQQTQGSTLDFGFNLTAVLKGFTSTSKRSFAMVKPDYINVKLNSTTITPAGFISFGQKTSLFSPQQDEQIYKSQLFKLFKNLQEIKCSFKFNSLRRILQYYNQVLLKPEKKQKQQENGQISEQNQQIDYDQRQLPLSNKGIFKEKLQIKVVYSNKIHAQAVINYRSEEVMFRLVAVLKKIFTKWSQG